MDHAIEWWVDLETIVQKNQFGEEHQGTRVLNTFDSY